MADNPLILDVAEGRWLTLPGPVDPGEERPEHASNRFLETGLSYEVDADLLFRLGLRVNAKPLRILGELAGPGCVLLTRALVRNGCTGLVLALQPFRGVCEDGRVRPITWQRAYRPDTGRYERLRLPRPCEVVRSARGTFSAVSRPQAHGWNEGGYPLFEAADFALLLQSEG